LVNSGEKGLHVELFIFARFHAREGQEKSVAAALRDEVPLARAELGCLGHEAYRSTRDPCLFFIHSHWANEAAFAAHAELPHTVHFLERVEPLIDHKLDVNRTVPLSATPKDRKGKDMMYFAVTRERGPAWNTTVPIREQQQWAEHAAFMNQLDKEGFIILGGPVGDETKPGFSKALFLMKADSERTIRKRLETDPYTQTMMLVTTKIEPWEILLGNDRLSLAM
jgi:quinol monooxygenase YgiN/uncharacterized protein YciI